MGGAVTSGQAKADRKNAPRALYEDVNGRWERQKQGYIIARLIQISVCSCFSPGASSGTRGLSESPPITPVRHKPPGGIIDVDLKAPRGTAESQFHGLGQGIPDRKDSRHKVIMAKTGDLLGVWTP